MCGVVVLTMSGKPQVNEVAHSSIEETDHTVRSLFKTNMSKPVQLQG